MRFIPTKVHGVLDYLVGLILVASPWIFGFSQADHQAAVWIPIVLGIGALVYSLITAYEFGVVHLLPMRLHLVLDIMSGVFLAASPWLFGFANEVYWPHLIFGLFEISAGLTTRATSRPAVPRSAVMA